MKPSKSAATVTLIQDREVFQTTYREANRERANAQHLGRRCAPKERSLFAEPITPDDPRDDEVLIRIAGVGANRLAARNTHTMTQGNVALIRDALIAIGLALGVASASALMSSILSPL
jgi:hypothetical protein